LGSKIYSIVFIICLIAGILFLSLSNADEIETGDCIVLGHAGSGFQGPFTLTSPNSKRSFENALLKHAIQGIESDVQISEDGSAVLYHDEFLESMTHCKGKITESTWTNIAGCQYDRMMEVGDDVLWNLDSLLTLIKSLDYSPTLSLDIKFYSPQYEMDSIFNKAINALSFTLTKYNWTQNTLLESVHADFLHLANQEIPGLRTFFYTTTTTMALEQAALYNFDGISIQNKLVTKEEVARLHNAGLEVMIWDVKNDLQSIRAMEKGADFIQVDKIDNYSKSTTDQSK